MRRVAGLDWRLALMLAVTFVLAAMAVTRSRLSSAENKGPRVETQQKSESGLKGEKPTQGFGQTAGNRPLRADQLATGSPSREGKDQTKQGDNEGAEYWPSIFGVRLKITDSLLVLLTAALAIYTRELNRSTLKLWTAGERQIGEAARAAAAAERSADLAKDALIASNRAWIRPTVGIGSDPFTLNETGCRCAVRIDFTNVGNSPALRVIPQVWMLIQNSGGTDDLLRRHSAKCDEMRAANTQWSHTLFPGESFCGVTGKGTTQIPAHAAAEEVDAGLSGFQWEQDGPEGIRVPNMAVYVGGCITYTIAAEPDGRHQTRFLYVLYGPRANFNRGDTYVPHGLLRLSLPTNGMGNAAD